MGQGARPSRRGRRVVGDHACYCPCVLLLLAACSPTWVGPSASGPRADADSDTDSDTDTDTDSDTDTDTDTDTDPIECAWPSPEQPDDRALSTNVSGVQELTTVDGYTDAYLYDATGYLKVGVREDWGGSVVFFGLSDGAAGVNASNTIDGNDTGREVQVAFYDPDRAMQGCAWDASCATEASTCPVSITYLGWNPVQGGNRCNHGSGASSVVATPDGGLAVSTTPFHWNPDWEARTCTSDGCDDSSTSYLAGEIELTQTLRFARTHVVELRYTATETVGMSHGWTYQEMPTLYTSNGTAGPDLWRLLTSDGTEVTIDTPGNDGFYYENAVSPEPWVTLQDDSASYGVGILYENGITKFQGWQNRSLPFNNVRALFPFSIPAWGTVNARAYLMIGSFETIRSEATAVLDALAPFGTLDSPVDGASVAAMMEISGWTIDNRGVTQVVARVDEGAELALAYGAARPDVPLAWPGYPGGDYVGYTGTVAMAAGACHLVEIVATDADGNERTIDRAVVVVP